MPGNEGIICEDIIEHLDPVMLEDSISKLFTIGFLTMAVEWGVHWCVETYRQES